MPSSIHFLTLSTFSALFLFTSSSTTAQQSLLAASDPAEEAETCGGDPLMGAPLFESCSSCHALSADAPALPGPHLEGLFGRQVGSVPGFTYSPALSGKDFDWDIASLRSFLDGTMAVPNHPVILDLQSRSDLMTYVRIEGRSPPPAPDEVQAPARVIAMEGDMAYGEYLASDCLSCHNSAAVETGNIPGLNGLDTEYFITQLYRYRLRALDNEVMQIQAARLSEEEIAALAAYFSAATP